MIRSRHLRRLVSSIAILMLVWCQTSAVAQAGLIVMPAPTTEAAASAPCDHAATDNRSDTTQQSGCATRCQSRDASFETAKIHLPAVDDLPLAVASATVLAPVAACAAPNDQAAERAAPPPLILVYCRLLI